MASQPEHRVVINAHASFANRWPRCFRSSRGGDGPHSTAAVHVAITRTVKAGMEETFQKAQFRVCS